MGVINVENIGKIYEYYKKGEGIKGSLKNLFHREKLYKEAVKEVSFNIDEGSIVGFIGLNGAGKTTTLKMLSGIIKPTSGKIDILGFDPFEKKDDFLRRITMVMGQKSQLWWDLPAYETFELNRQIFDVGKENFNSIVNELSTSLNVENLLDVQVRRLSLGERMKMEFIAALIHSPSIIFLDEPTIGLDFFSQENIRLFLKAYNQKNKTTIILTSHNLEDIAYLCDYLIIIDKGKIIYNDNYNNFIKQYSSNKVLTIKFKSGEKIKFDNNVIKEDDIINFMDNEVKISVDESNLVSVTNYFFSNFQKGLQDIIIEGSDMKEIIKRIYSEEGK